MAYTTINKSSEHFNTKLYTGNGGTQTISGIGFQPDFTWVKSRNYGYYHYLQDAVRGSSNVLYTNNNDAQATGVTAGISAWNSDGYVTGSQGALNGSGKTFAAWNWKANGTGSANTAGSINSTVSANTTAGFSIVSYTGTGANATVGHGLSSAPSMIIVKGRNFVDNWCVFHSSLGGGKKLKLNITNGEITTSESWNNTSPTSSVFSLGIDGETNNNGSAMIAYCFADVQGYSKFSSYVGNGNADGTFVYTGFKPAFVITKRTDGVGNWLMYDTKRIGYNPSNYFLFPHLSNAEDTSNAQWLDLHSNGFKTRATSTTINGSGNSYIYMAFAEQPLVGDNPATAR